MSSSRLWIQTCVLLLTCFGFTSPSFARSSFDGAWSVVVVTRAGACTPTLRYPVAIANGIITNGGDSPASVSGRVAPTGAVRVTVQSGGSWATGSGHLSTTGGSGVWRGQGSSGLFDDVVVHKVDILSWRWPASMVFSPVEHRPVTPGSEFWQISDL